eukprot:m.21825 g.21825  ORF g.21825 m.21825 type:complete len:319 (-) comp3670_c0_seq2:14-970(-)
MPGALPQEGLPPRNRCIQGARSPKRFETTERNTAQDRSHGCLGRQPRPRAGVPRPAARHSRHARDAAAGAGRQGPAVAGPGRTRAAARRQLQRGHGVCQGPRAARGSAVGDAIVTPYGLHRAWQPELLCLVAAYSRYIHGFDDPAIIAGQGTCGLEILDVVPDADVIVVPVGGGGLIAGIALATKTLRPDIRIVGVEVETSACFQQAMAAGRPVPITVQPSLADGLVVSQAGTNAFEVARNLVDEVVTVDEAEIAAAIIRVLEIEKCVVEGAGAIGVAALLAGKVAGIAGKKVVTTLSGSNIDMAVLGRLISASTAEA